MPDSEMQQLWKYISILNGGKCPPMLRRAYTSSYLHDQNSKSPMRWRSYFQKLGARNPRPCRGRNDFHSTIREQLQLPGQESASRTACGSTVAVACQLVNTEEKTG